MHLSRAPSRFSDSVRRPWQIQGGMLGDASAGVLLPVSSGEGQRLERWANLPIVQPKTQENCERESEQASEKEESLLRTNTCIHL